MNAPWRNHWVGVDLDGTLAHHEPDDSSEVIGKPVGPMLKRVRLWLAHGIEVRLMTARAGDPEQLPLIRAWLARHDLSELAITNAKDYQMLELWDDRAGQVETNRGIPVGPSRLGPLKGFWLA